TARGRGRFRVGLRGQHRHARRFDLGDDVAQRGTVHAEVQLLAGLADAGELVGEQLGPRPADDARPEVARLAARGGVEGGGLACEGRASGSGSSGGIDRPTTRGQRWRSWRGAAAWKGRAWTAGTPRSRRRERISAAAFAVKVTARTWRGFSCPVATP